MDRYEIRIIGHLDSRRARALGCSALRLLPGGESLVVLDAIDQAALYGLLTRLRDAGLELVAVRRVPAPAGRGSGAATAHASSKEASRVAD
jgi:hypothetical protein